MEFLAQEQTLSRCSQNIDAMPVHDGVRKALSRFSTICAAELMRRLCGLDHATGCEGHAARWQSSMSGSAVSPQFNGGLIVRFVLPAREVCRCRFYGRLRCRICPRGLWRSGDGACTRCGSRDRRLVSYWNLRLRLQGGGSAAAGQHEKVPAPCDDGRCERSEHDLAGEPCRGLRRHRTERSDQDRGHQRLHD